MKKYFKPTIFVLVIVVVLIFLHYSNILRPLENLLSTIFEPIQKPLYSWSDKVFKTEEKKEIEEIEEANNQLTEKITQLINENSRLTTKIKEYEELNEQLKYIAEREHNALPARVLAQSTDQTSRTLIINQGTAQGLTVGLPVIVEDGLLIGKIESVEKNTAKVILITDNFCQFTAQVQNETNSPGMVKGQHGLSLKMELIPKTEKIKQGEIIITAGLEENVPAGLIIGEIERIDNSPGELWQTALINTLADFSQLNIVNVILPASEL